MVGIRQFDEGALIKNALAVFRDKGFVATSMNDLAVASGVHRGSLYNAYGSKDAIFLVAFEAYSVQYASMIKDVLNAPSAEVAITAFFDAVISSLVGGSPARGCLSTRTATEVNEVEPEVRKRLQRWLRDLEVLIASALRTEPLVSGLTLPPDEVANLLVTFTRGLAVMERLYGDEAQLRDTASAMTRILIR